MLWKGAFVAHIDRPESISNQGFEGLYFPTELKEVRVRPPRVTRKLATRLATNGVNDLTCTIEAYTLKQHRISDRESCRVNSNAKPNCSHR